jgi:hypothetical protein
MNRKAHFHTVLVIATILALGTVPLAGAHPLRASQATHQNEGGWFEAALQWLGALTGVQRSTSAQKSKPVTESPSEGGSTTGGSCVDPAGNPKPWCL